MKKISFVFLLLPIIVHCQQPQKAPLHFQSYAYSLGVTPSENLSIVTRAGEVAFADSANGIWRMAPPERDSKLSFSGLTLDNAIFFSKDTGFVSGFIYNGGKYNIIYRTVNNGKTWTKTEFGQDGWVDDAISLDKGIAWMSVAGSGLAYTENYGETWTKVDLPEKKQRFATIFFNQSKEGIIGSLWNKIAYTENNGKDWRSIPTPLDQNKYQKTDKESRPEVNKVAIYKNYLLVMQEGLVFYSPKDSINWTWLPSYNIFYTDVNNTSLYFSAKNAFVRAGDSLNAIESFAYTGPHYSGACRNGKLFVIGDGKMIKLSAGNKIATSAIVSDDIASVQPESFGFTKSGGYGNIGNKIYIQKNYNEWVYAFDLPFSVDSGVLSMPEENVILLTLPNDSLKYYTIDTKEVLVKSKQNLITAFSKSRIARIVFNNGSSGCFHHYNNSKVYDLDGNEFVLNELDSKQERKTLTLTNEPTSFNASLVDSFLYNLPATMNKMATLKDLGFTERDFDQCKKDILKYKAALAAGKKIDEKGFVFRQNNIDFDRLLALVDSVKLIDDANLNSILFQLSEMYSTTSFWKSVQLVTYDRRVLTISNNYYEPNAFHFPWIVTTMGFTRANSSIEVNKFLNAVYPEFLNTKQADKVEVLHTLVKRLY